MHKVLIVDDHPFFLHGFGQYLEAAGDFSISTALSVDEAISNIDLEQPDLAMLDVTMHNGGGLCVLRHLRLHYPAVPAMFLTVHIDPEQTIAAMRLGIRGIVLKDSDPDMIVEAMGIVLAGGKSFESGITEVALRYSIDQPTRMVRSDDLLTKRELEIVGLVCSGLRNRDIAQRCNLAEGTVKIHLNNIFRKLGVASRSELIVHRGGMLTTGDNAKKAH
jgi:two-component system, NarL family, nitrate/nitrite response regulator NarL